AKRDWGFAGDFVDAMWRMLQQDKAEDFVIATGETHTVQELVETAFAAADLDWKKYVKIDKEFVRPAEVDLLKGNADKARKLLGWEPKVGFKELIQRMVRSDLESLKADQALPSCAR